jgi:hypothetical protein
MRCLNQIALSKDGRAVTYCQLEFGHTGDHQVTLVTLESKRCQATLESEGLQIQCGLPKGHSSRHGNSTAQVTWS